MKKSKDFYERNIRIILDVQYIKLSNFTVHENSVSNAPLIYLVVDIKSFSIFKVYGRYSLKSHTYKTTHTLLQTQAVSICLFKLQDRLIGEYFVPVLNRGF